MRMVYKIHDQLELCTIWSLLEAMINLACKIENQLVQRKLVYPRRDFFDLGNDKQKATYPHFASSNSASAKPVVEHAPMHSRTIRKQPSFQGPPTQTTSNPYAKPLPIQCYRCNQ